MYNIPLLEIQIGYIILIKQPDDFVKVKLYKLDLYFYFKPMI